MNEKISMDRIAIIAVFTALQKLCKLEAWDSVKDVVSTILEEARGGEL